MSNHEVRNSVPLNPIYYNAPIRIAEIVRLDPRVLAVHNWEFDLWLYVAGEHSPMIESKYKIRFRYGNGIPEDLNSLFTLIDENRYTYERSDELGFTEENRISTMLGRNVGSV